MEKINFKGYPDITTPINPSNLNTLQDNVEEGINEKSQQNITLNGAGVKCGYKIDGKDVYVKRISGVLSGTSSTYLPIGLGIGGFTALYYEASFNTGSAVFQSNTPRGSGTNVEATQLFSYWNLPDDTLRVTSNGYDRTGTIIVANLYYYYNS